MATISNLTTSSKSYLDTWQLEKRVDGLEVAVDGVRDSLAPLIINSWEDTNYVSNLCATTDRISVLEESFNDMQKNIEQMNDSIKELTRALENYTAPAGDNQDDRTSKIIGDLEFFPPNYYDYDILLDENIWIFPKVEEKPIKIVHKNEDYTQYGYKEKDYSWCDAFTSYLMNKMDNDEKYKPLLDIGINIKDSNNQFKSTYDILQELSEKWSQL